jgi:cholesterol transport system auxiliary component
MKKLTFGLAFLLLNLLSACSVKSIENQYKLDSYSSKVYSAAKSPITILVSQPEASAGYQSEQMLYIKKPFGLNPYAKSAWIAPPANLLAPLITQSLYDSHYFYAVVSPTYGDTTDYRLDTQLLELQQNFLCKPSRIELVIKVVLTQVREGRIIGSRIIRTQIDCPQESPYGGVIAANLAAEKFTQITTRFVIQHIKNSKLANIAKN